MFIKKILFSSILFFITFFFPSFINADNLFTDDFENGEIVDKWTNVSGTWYREIFSESTWARVSSEASSDNEIQTGNSTWTDYYFDLDIFKIEGEDINLFFRIQNSRYLNLPGHNLPVAYGLHLKHNFIALQKFTSDAGSELQIVTDNVPFLNLTLKHITIKLDGNNIQIFINNSVNPIINYNDNIQPYLSGGIAIGAITGSAAQNVRFDNVVVTELPDETATPTPTPSPSPTPTPSPTLEPTESPIATASATPVSLNVPSLKQYHEPWKNKKYNHINASIEQFGCALTSASMVLQYYGYNIMPDKLNRWLNNQNDGYIRNGLINWLVVSRYTKLNDSLISPTLEYKRLLPTIENLTNELNNNRPAILKQPGHFVVAKSILPTTFGINDPGYENRDDLTHYGNEFLAINSYTPTHSDLSYMMFVVDSDINLDLFDSNENPVITDKFTEEPINGLINPTLKSGETVKILLNQKPINGKYKLKVTGPKGPYKLDSYLYDSKGKVSKQNTVGKLSGRDVDTFYINYDQKKNKLDFKFWFKYFFKFFENWD